MRRKWAREDTRQNYAGLHKHQESDKNASRMMRRFDAEDGGGYPGRVEAVRKFVGGRRVRPREESPSSIGQGAR